MCRIRHFDLHDFIQVWSWMDSTSQPEGHDFYQYNNLVWFARVQRTESFWVSASKFKFSRICRSLNRYRFCVWKRHPLYVLYTYGPICIPRDPKSDQNRQSGQVRLKIRIFTVGWYPFIIPKKIQPGLIFDPWMTKFMELQGSRSWCCMCRANGLDGWWEDAMRRSGFNRNHFKWMMSLKVVFSVFRLQEGLKGLQESGSWYQPMLSCMAHSLVWLKFTGSSVLMMSKRFSTIPKFRSTQMDPNCDCQAGTHGRTGYLDYGSRRCRVLRCFKTSNLLNWRVQGRPIFDYHGYLATDLPGP